MQNGSLIEDVANCASRYKIKLEFSRKNRQQAAN